MDSWSRGWLYAYQYSMQASIHRELLVAAPLERVWDFFSTPTNLNVLTPPDMAFHIVSDLPAKMYAGQIIEYRIAVFPHIWLRWVTEIRHVRDGSYFVDEQRFGPYQFWYHEHRFEPTDTGVKVIDHVTYRIGFGPIGWLMHRLFIRRKLEQIFDFREQAVAKIFSSPVLNG